MLAASGLLPVALGVVIANAYLIQDHRRAAEKSALELSRALATAVDAELKSAIAVLETLSSSDHLRESRLPEFHALASAIAQQRRWRAIVLSDATGAPLLNTTTPPGDPVPPPLDEASLKQASLSRSPVISNVKPGRRFPGDAFAVRVPVFRDGRLVNVVSGVVNTDQLLQVLTRQNVPSTWVIGIFDQAGARVARTRFNPTARASPSLLALMADGAPEGMGPTHTLEGVPSFSGFSRLKGSDWAVAVAIPAQEVYLATLPLLLSLAAGLLASLALSSYLALVFARRVSQPIQALRDAAQMLGRSGGIAVPPLGIAELDEVGRALNRASTDRDTALREAHEAGIERERLLQQVTQALRLAEEAGRSKDEFLAVLGHELRNPLAPITTALQLMERKGDERTAGERQVLRRQVGHMVRLVDDLLDISRMARKQLTVRMQPLQLAPVLEPAIQGCRPLLGGRSLNTRIDPAAARCWVQGDEVRLAQVLNNVLGNAVKFTSETGRIDVSMRVEGADVLVDVEDDGSGMPADVLEHAFDTFYQAPQGMDRARGGLGLGLAIVKSVMDLHGGKVQAFSPGAGHGTRIRLRLPCIEPPPLPAGTEQPEPAKAKGKVLVVDDNQDAADTAGALLELAGYQVRVEYHPEAALKLMADFRPDAAVLDIGMPGMNGYELAAALRKPPHSFVGQLIALTGYGQLNDKALALQAGFDAHLTKPASAESLLDLLSSREAAPD